MPSHRRLRPLKAWRYVGVFGPELMVCAGVVRVGPARQTFWALWDRGGVRLRERTRLSGGVVPLAAGRARLGGGVVRLAAGRVRLGGGAVRLPPGRVCIDDGDVHVDLALAETAGVETVCPAGDDYAWTRKQGGIAARGTVRIAGVRVDLEARALVDDTAAYYPRHTRWRWAAGVGVSDDGRELAWNLVSGVNDPPSGSERTVWLDGVAREVGPCTFAEDLSAVDGLRFHAEAVRERRENLLLVRSTYRQPFGTFSGTLPGGTRLAAGYGVMEYHDVHW